MRRLRRRTAPLTAFFLAVSTVASVVPTTPAAAASLPGTRPAVVIRGLGYGHGRGLSQWGSWGWATHPDPALRKTWQQIIDFYYGGGGRRLVSFPLDPAAPRIDTTQMSVRLTALDADTNYGGITSVIAESGDASAAWTGGGTGTATYSSIVAVPVTGGGYDVWASATKTCALTTTAAQALTRVGRNVSGPVRITTPRRNYSTATYMHVPGVCQPGGKIIYYRGDVRAVRDANGDARTINVVPVSSYLRGVVPRESPASWGNDAGGAGMNALRAQAVAARSYALRQDRYSYAKTCDSQSCQVYGGAWMRTVGAALSTTTTLEQATTNQAITDTDSQVVVGSDNLPASTEFTSSNGGRTAGGTFPAKADPGDAYAASLYGKVTNHSWTRVASAADVEAKYPSIGTFTSIVTTHDGLGGAWNGYATSVRISGTSGSVTRTGWEFRGDWDLLNPWFETTLVDAPSIIANPVGSILYVGDSVSLGAMDEVADMVRTAYPSFTYVACQGRQMVGTGCVPAAGNVFDKDGLGVVNLMGSSALAAHDVVVVALGYNDSAGTYAQEVSTMINALKAKDVKRIVFVNMSAGRLVDDTRYDALNLVLTQARMAEPGLVRILNWYDETGDASRWRWFNNSPSTGTTSDVHLNNTGQAEFAAFLRRELDVLRSAGDLTPANMAPANIVPGVPVRNGNNGFHVKSLQGAVNKKLAALGLRFTVSGRTKSAVHVDGYYGAECVAAVIAIQTKLAMRATGVVDFATWQAIFGNPGGNVALLRTGTTSYPSTKHADVVTVRAALGKVYSRSLGTSNVYDATLANWVRTFQRTNGLYVSGIVNGAVMRAILLAASRS